jgi:fatty-acyl-CoA synthase
MDGPSLTRSYVRGATATPLLGLTIGELFDRTVAQHGEREALVSRPQRQRFTYAELQRVVHRAAGGLLALGLRKGDHLGIWAPNRSEWVLVQFATALVAQTNAAEESTCACTLSTGAASAGLALALV